LGLRCLQGSALSQEVPSMKVQDLVQARQEVFSVQESATVHDAA
jgi:hypothetical protein